MPIFVFKSARNVPRDVPMVAFFLGRHRDNPSLRKTPALEIRAERFRRLNSLRFQCLATSFIWHPHC